MINLKEIHATILAEGKYTVIVKGTSDNDIRLALDLTQLIAESLSRATGTRYFSDGTPWPLQNGNTEVDIMEDN